MKRFVWFLFLFVFTFGCSKETTVLKSLKTDGCIEQVVIPVSQHSIADSDVQTVNALFAKSNYNNSNLRYYQYLHDSEQTYYPPYAKFDSKAVRADQYANGLRIFNTQVIFNWYNDTLNFAGGPFTHGTNLNTKFALAVGQLRESFLATIEQNDGKGEFYRDSCFKAESGYFDLNVGIPNTNEHLVKAWRVTLLNSESPSEYPIAFYKDDDGNLIGYDNGIRTFH